LSCSPLMKKPCGGISIAAAEQDVAGEEQLESSAANGSPTFAAMTAGIEVEAKEESAAFTHTKSQIADSAKVNTVTKHFDESHAPIHESACTAARVARNELPQDSEVVALKAEFETVDQARKRARNSGDDPVEDNFGDDLVEDMLALSLHSHDAEDRSTRKAAIAGIESLLDDADAAKSRLNTLHEPLQTRSDEKQQALAEQQQEAESARATPVRSDFKPVPPREAMPARTPQAQPEQAVPRPVGPL